MMMGVGMIGELCKRGRVGGWVLLVLLAGCGGGGMDGGAGSLDAPQEDTAEDDHSAPVDYGWGPMQPVMPMREQLNMVEASGDWRAEVLPTAGHMFPYERTDQVAGLVRDFLA